MSEEFRGKLMQILKETDAELPRYELASCMRSLIERVSDLLADWDCYHPKKDKDGE